MEAKRTPLIELLERVPRDAVLVVEHDQFSSSSHPVGRLCHEAAAALEAAREDAWQPIETAPKPDIGANGFGKRLLLVVDCGDGTIPSVRRGYWAGTDWYLDCCNGLATACGYRVTHWRPLPAPPAIDQARGKAGQEVGNG